MEVQKSVQNGVQTLHLDLHLRTPYLPRIRRHLRPGCRNAVPLLEREIALSPTPPSTGAMEPGYHWSHGAW